MPGTDISPDGLTYRQAGVDIAEGDRFVDLIKPLAASTRRPEVMTGLGSFGSLFRLNTRKYKDPVLVSGTDGVGTKLKIAFMTGRHNTVGIDLVAMCVNDILTLGAEPLFFLDYLATGKLKPEDAASVIEGVAEGCRQAGAALVGGETAEMPGFYAAGEYDAAGFAVGVVDKSRIVDGRSIRPGDVVIGLPSSGLHSNGYSLARKLFFEMKGYDARKRIPALGQSLGDALLAPTRIYVKPVLGLLKRYEIKGMAHITGGGITGNLPRILPKGVRAAIRKDAWTVPPIFGLIKKLGGVAEDEMFRTFNMGMGFMLVVSPEISGRVAASLCRAGENPVVIGCIEKGREDVLYV